jgi:hypothetical protein
MKAKVNTPEYMSAAALNDSTLSSELVAQYLKELGDVFRDSLTTALADGSAEGTPNTDSEVYLKNYTKVSLVVIYCAIMVLRSISVSASSSPMPDPKYTGDQA